MTPIYNADTLRNVSATARIAEFTRIQDNYVPQALCKINDANFYAANEGRNSSITTLDLVAMGLTTENTQNYLRIGLKTELETLGLKVDILMIANGKIRISCKW